MKNNVKTLLCMFLFVLGVCGCGDRNSTPDFNDDSATDRNETYSYDDQSLVPDSMENSVGNNAEFPVNKLLYEGANIRLSCSKILRTGIEFEVENLSDSEVLVTLNIGLDGVGYNSWGDGNDWTIAPHETKVCTENGDLTYVEHARMSLHGNVFIDGLGVEEFSICDSELGGNEHHEVELTEGTAQYSSDDLMVGYVDADAQGLNFYVENKREVSITIGFDSLTS